MGPGCCYTSQMGKLRSTDRISAWRLSQDAFLCGTDILESRGPCPHRDTEGSTGGSPKAQPGAQSSPLQAAAGQAGPHLQPHARGAGRALPQGKVLWGPLPGHQGRSPRFLEGALRCPVSGPPCQNPGCEGARGTGDPKRPCQAQLTLPTQPHSCVLPWAEFQALLNTCHAVEPGATAQALCSTMDLTFSGHVSIFEFDIFTRLFQVREDRQVPRV